VPKVKRLSRCDCRRAGVGLVVLGVAFALAPVSSGQISNDAAQLFGGAYLSTAVTKGGKPHPLFEGAEIRVEFEPGDEYDSVLWRAGCNGFGADVEITDQRLVTRRILGTAMLCLPPQLVRQDKWMGRFFASDPKWRARQGRSLKLTVGWREVKLRRPAGR
jgi:heat shock protein HslJ